MRKSKKIILSGLLLSLYIILARFVSFKSQIFVISFSFIPVIISAILLGPKYSMLIAGLGDFLGATLFPFGSYFVGFTIIELITGYLYGIFLYNNDDKEEKNQTENISHSFYKGKQLIFRLIISSFINLIIIGIFITGLMISKLYGQAFVLVLSSRAITKIIMLFVQVIVISLLNKTIIKYSEKYLLD